MSAGGRFGIDLNTGVVTVAGAIDRELAASYDITVRATSTDTSFTTRIFTITVGDFDEYDVLTVSDSDPAVDTVAEDATIGATVGITAAASDGDATTNAITYTLDNSAGGRFAINGSSGVVTVNAALDFETSSSHNIIVRATSADGSSATQGFTISVTDVNESGVTGISDTDGAAEFVLENAVNGTAVGLTAFADDADASDTVSYTLDDSAGGRFGIDLNTGVVTVAGAIDRELAASYDITVRATSTDTSFTTRIFTITVGDVDEYDVLTVTDSDPAVDTVAEDATIGASVGITAAASDGDATTNAITYTLDNSAGGRFAINGSSGVVTVNAALDFETSSSHNIIVRATSADGSSATQGFTISVTDVNESGVTGISDTDGGGGVRAGERRQRHGGGLDRLRG